MKKIRLLLCLGVTVIFFSCSDVFTTSLASWAQRDPSSLIPPVTTGNVDELILMTENSPDQSLALLKSIASTGADPKLQSAALKAAANASGLGAAILQHADDISTIDDSNAKELVIDSLNSLGNVVETGNVLASLLPDPADTANWNNFIDTSSAEDLAMAAAVLLAGKARESGDPENYIDSFPSSPQPGSPEALARDLADAARSKNSGGGFLEDMLNGLNL
jgi:hypothetical protein